MGTKGLLLGLSVIIKLVKFGLLHNPNVSCLKSSCLCLLRYICKGSHPSKNTFFFMKLGPGRPSAGGPRMDRRAETCPGVVKISRLTSEGTLSNSSADQTF